MRLPDGFVVRLEPDVIRLAEGAVVVGGSPLTAIQVASALQSELGGPDIRVRDENTARLARRLLATNLATPVLDEVRPVDRDELTVVIPVKDRTAQLERALRALDGLRVIVVDDGSDDPLAVQEVAQRYGACCIPLDVNVGPAGARNAGLAVVGTDFVAFVDSDVRVSAEDLLLLTRHFCDPDVALVAPRVVGDSVAADPRWFEVYDEIGSSLTLGTRASTVRPGARVAWLPSACMVGRTRSLGGGFDAQLRVGEDVDLVWRLARAEQVVRFDPSVAAKHDTRSTVRGWLGRKFLYGSGGALLARRHGNRIAPAILTPLQAAAGVGLLLRSRWGVVLAVVVFVRGLIGVRRVLPAVPGRTWIAAQIALRGIGWAVRQESALAVRHWWPVTAVGVACSRTARKLAVSALVVDAFVAWREERGTPRELGFFARWGGRRLSDLAYGAGLWWGAVRNRSIRVLLPRRPAGFA